MKESIQIDQSSYVDPSTIINYLSFVITVYNSCPLHTSA